MQSQTHTHPVALDARQIHARAAALATLNWVRAHRATWAPIVDDEIEEVAPASEPVSPSIQVTPAVPAPVANRRPSQLGIATIAAIQSCLALARRVPRTAVLRVAPMIALAVVAAATRPYWSAAATHPYWSKVSAIPQAVSAIPQAGGRLVTSALASGAELATTAHAVPAAEVTGPRVGRLEVISDPPGAQVTVDGQIRGITPLTLDNLRAGSHGIVLERDGGSVRRVVTVKAQETAQVTEALFAGWLTVFSPFDVAITEGSRVIRLDDRHQVMLPPGMHELRFENRALGYAQVRRVDVKPGEFMSLSVIPPKSTLTVTSTTPADVWIDGLSMGHAPLVKVPVELGTREVVLRAANGDEWHRAVTVTAKPVALEADFSKPAF